MLGLIIVIIAIWLMLDFITKDNPPGSDKNYPPPDTPNNGGYPPPKTQ